MSSQDGQRVKVRAVDLVKEYRLPGRSKDAPPFRAVSDVSFSIASGTTMALVGESGSGKSTTGRLLVGLTTPTSGRVEIDGIVVDEASRKVRKQLSKHIQMVFQNPMGSLDPRMRIGRAIAEPLRIQGLSRTERDSRVREVMDQVGLDTALSVRYPHEFSGGQRQRIAIARALAPAPSILVLDEAVSALDVSIQAQVLNLLEDLQADLGLTYVFISHDLSVVRHVADTVCVMQHGELVEQGTIHDVFDRPQHEYTQMLLAAIPSADPAKRTFR